jgi:hypothetical protein
MSQPFITDVEDHRMKTAVEPTEKRIQLAVFRPQRRHTIPAIQLLLKDLAADLAQMLKLRCANIPSAPQRGSFQQTRSTLSSAKTPAKPQW